MWLIADSGGTSTNWVYGDDEKITGRFQTASLHPRNLECFPAEDVERLRKLNTDFHFGSFHFYGAGMSNPENVAQISTFFRKEIGFSDLHVETDALAAGLACCGFDHGYVAILGTGSILVEMNDGKIANRVGGLGPQAGDEGSAYYFSKLLMEYLGEEENWTVPLKQLFGSKEDFQQKYNETTGASEMAKLAGLTAGMGLEELHAINFRKFIRTHLPDLNSHQKILNTVGSYGYYQKAILSNELARVGWELEQCLIDPIEALANRLFKKS